MYAIIPLAVRCRSIQLTGKISVQHKRRGAWCVGWLASGIGQVTVPSVAIGNPERHVRKASHRGSKQQ